MDNNHYWIQNFIFNEMLEIKIRQKEKEKLTT